ncbi:MAG: hypothetical protein U0821_11825 [Chloroflexota bacterium]
MQATSSVTFAWRRLALAIAITLLAMAIAPAEPVAAGRGGPKIKLDRSVYVPGETVRLTGLRFTPRGKVRVRIVGSPTSCDPDEEVVDDRWKSDRDGEIDEIIYAVERNDCGTYEVTARDVEQDIEARWTKFRVVRKR